MSFTENYWWMNGSCTPLPCLLWSWSFSKLHLHQFLHLTFRAIWVISENKIPCTEHQKDGLPSKNHFEGYFILYNWLTYFLYLSVILRQSILLWIVIPSLSTVQQFVARKLYLLVNHGVQFFRSILHLINWIIKDKVS